MTAIRCRVSTPEHVSMVSGHSLVRVLLGTRARCATTTLTSACRRRAQMAPLAATRALATTVNVRRALLASTARRILMSASRRLVLTVRRVSTEIITLCVCVLLGLRVRNVVSTLTSVARHPVGMAASAATRLVRSRVRVRPVTMARCVPSTLTSVHHRRARTVHWHVLIW